MLPHELLAPGEIIMLRSDNIFVDIDVNQFRRVCWIVRRYEFNHLIGMTPFSEREKLWDIYDHSFKIRVMNCFGFSINF